jgi:hypothetical protein
LRQLTWSGGPVPHHSPHMWLKVSRHVPSYSVGTLNCLGIPSITLERCARPIRTREPACLLAFIAAIRLRSSWPGRIPRPLFLGGSENIRRGSPAHARSRTSDLRELKPQVRATTPRAWEQHGERAHPTPQPTSSRGRGTTPRHTPPAGQEGAPPTPHPTSSMVSLHATPHQHHWEGAHPLGPPSVAPE